MSIVLCSWGRTVEGGTEEALTLARGLASQRGTELRWLVAGAAAELAAPLAAKHGVAALDIVNDARLSDASPDLLVAALAQYCQQVRPTTILVNQTAGARLIAPRLAGRLDVPVVTNAFAITPADQVLHVTATAFGGDTNVVYALAAPVNVIAIVTTSLVAAAAEVPSSPVRREVAVDLAGVAERFRVTSAPSAAGPRLEDAEIIVAGGRGLGSAQNFELVKQLAEALGGMWGGSRAIVDDGWIDSSRQVGLTGKITRPALYVAVGISGASQHMAGCSAAKTIVAINKDRDASIFRYARYGIVGDALEMVPALIQAARG